jgi:hypothetical protein
MSKRAAVGKRTVRVIRILILSFVTAEVVLTVVLELWTLAAALVLLFLVTICIYCLWLAAGLRRVLVGTLRDLAPGTVELPAFKRVPSR